MVFPKFGLVVSFYQNLCVSTIHEDAPCANGTNAFAVNFHESLTNGCFTNTRTSETIKEDVTQNNIMM